MFEKDIRIIFNCFLLVGMPCLRENKPDPEKKRTLKRMLYRTWEFQMTAFGFFTIVATYFFFPSDNISSTLIGMSVNALITSLRLTFIYKKSQILRAVNRMDTFMKHSLQSYRPRQKRVMPVCVCCIFLPMAAHVCLMGIIVTHYDYYREEMAMYFTENSMFSNVYGMCLFQSAFIFHFYLIPSICMILIGYIYFVYGEAYEQALLEVTRDLASGFHASNVRRCLRTLKELYYIHQELEDALSFGTFNAYVLCLMNFFNVVSASKYYCDKKGTNSELNIYWALIFAWTLLWVVVLILAGSRLATAGSSKGNIRRDLVLEFLESKRTGRKSEFHLLMILDCLKTDVFFTTWGLLKIDRELLLTTFGFIVTYSSLIITL